MKYKVIGNLRHNLKDYAIGDIIELNDVIAETLLQSGVIEKIEEKHIKIDENVSEEEEVVIKKPRKTKK